MKTLGSGVTVIPRGKPLPQVDAHAPLMSLPLLLGQSSGLIPSNIPYLSAPKEKRERWTQMLSVDTPLKIGIVWAGNAERQDDWMR